MSARSSLVLLPRVLLSIHCALLSVYSCLAFAEEASEWRIVRGESTIRFVATQARAEFEGGFDEFEVQIRFDPLDLEHSSARVDIGVASINTQSPDRDAVLRSEEWFHPERWPRAMFRTTEIREAVDGALDRYEAVARLTIRDVTKDVVFAFALVGNARLEGRLTIKRLEFGLGEGEWADTTWIGDEVSVLVRVVRDLDTGD